MIKVGHVEAGLRSFDFSMPEEINRLVTDRLSDLLFTPSQDANDNLQREGVASDRVCLVGNVMIDTLVRMLPMARKRMPLGLPERYALVTLHRPSNVDDSLWLLGMLRVLHEVATRLPVLFPIHPRTRSRLESGGLDVSAQNGLRFLEPLSYLEFLALQTRATLVITDSGGIQEETTYLGTPCLTVRENTERPITVSTGTNMLVGRDMQRLRAGIDAVLSGNFKRGVAPPLWDGCAAERIAYKILDQ
jgi:UDP-N-acetylglucosamine 2-epimerase (non-hydrolysing)